jgi:hypothetical protein
MFDELRQNEIDIDKQTLSFHINAINSRPTSRSPMTSFGRIFAYLALVCVQSDSEESVRENFRKTVEAFRTFHIPKAKRNNKPRILITL